MAQNNLENKCRKAIISMSRNVREIKYTLKDIGLFLNHIVESQKDYYSRAERPREYY